MAKGVSIKFKSYTETIPKLLDLIKMDQELKKHDKIVLKPSLRNSNSQNTSVDFTDAVLNYCLANKNPDAKIFVAEGSDGEDTLEVFEKFGYKNLAEKYSIGIIDLNNTEAQEVTSTNFMKFDSIMYPKILLDSFVISLPKLSEDSEIEMQSALSNMLGAFPARYYKGLFSKDKSKIRRWPLKFSLNDILACKMPDFTLIDASEQGSILAGMPFDMDKQAAKLLGKEWRAIQYLKLIEERFPEKPALEPNQVKTPE